MIEIDRYPVLVEGGPPSNYSACSPDVLGCVATGPTIDACVEEFRAALMGHFEVMREYGEAIPEPSGPSIRVVPPAAA